MYRWQHTNWTDCSKPKECQWHSLNRFPAFCRRIARKEASLFISINNYMISYSDWSTRRRALWWANSIENMSALFWIKETAALCAVVQSDTLSSTLRWMTICPFQGIGSHSLIKAIVGSQFWETRGIRRDGRIRFLPLLVPYLCSLPLFIFKELRAVGIAEGF